MEGDHLSLSFDAFHQSTQLLHHRCVILFGIPYMNTESRILRARLGKALQIVNGSTSGRQLIVRPLCRVLAGQLSDQRGRVPHLRCHASSCPVRRARYPRQEGLRHHGRDRPSSSSRCSISCIPRVQVFADKRYNRLDKRSKMPQWVSDNLLHSHLNLSTEMVRIDPSSSSAQLLQLIAAFHRA